MPARPRSPGLWQLLRLHADSANYIESLGRRFGPIFRAGAGAFDCVYVSEPSALKRIFSDKSGEFVTIAGESNMWQPMVGANSLFLATGENQRRLHKLLVAPLHGTRMTNYGRQICDLTREALDAIGLNATFRARDVMQDISLQVILRMVFGVAEGERYRLLKRRIAAWLAFLESPIASAFLSFGWLKKDLGAWSPWGKFLRQRQRIDELIFAEISERRASDEDRGDILSGLMHARDASGATLSDQELRDMLMTLLFAGHETTASAMAWAMYWVHERPEISKKILAEISTHSGVLEPTTLAKLPYLSAVCKETLRIYPVAAVTLDRETRESVEVLGRTLPPGTIVLGCVHLLHRRPELYPEPEQFKPERFLDRRFGPYEYMPFGAGARRCVGDALALFEMKLVLATILRNYEIELVNPGPVRVKRHVFTMVPAGGVHMIMRGRRPAHSMPRKESMVDGSA